MKWPVPYKKTAFAFFPTRIGNYMYWFVFYKKRTENDTYLNREVI